MAIKGKRKGKARSGRVVTPGPRPTYVAPKVPLFQKTGTKFVLVLILETLVFALLIGFGEQSEGDRQRAELEEFTTLVQTSLTSAGSSIQPSPGGALILPQIGGTLAALTGEQPETPEGVEAPTAEEIAAQTEEWTAGLTGAADSLATIQVPQEDLETEQFLALTEARTLMERGLRLHVGLARQVGVAAQLEGDAQQDLIATIQEQLQLAFAVFDSGYGKLNDVRLKAGIGAVQTSPAGGVPGLPGGVAPGGVPGFELPIQEPPIDVAPEGGGGGGGGNGGGKGGGGGNG